MKSSVSHLEKFELRQLIRDARKAAHNEVSTQMFAKQLSDFLISLEGKVEVTRIAAYLPYGTEPDLSEFITKAIASGIEVLMPVSHEDHSLSWVLWNGIDTQQGIFNFAEPVGEEASLESAQIVLMPALAADQFGNRLGKGKGYYDRALNNYEGITAALVFDSEFFEQIPVQEHDEPVDYIITESRLSPSVKLR